MERGELVSTILSIVWLFEKGNFLMKSLQNKYQRVERLLASVQGNGYNQMKLPKGAWDPITTDTKEVVARLVEILRSGSEA